MGDGRGPENRAREDDAEIVGLERPPRDHSIEYIGGNASHVVVARRYPERRLIMSPGHQWLVILVRLEPFERIKHERREVARIRRWRCVRDALALKIGEFLVRAILSHNR